MKLSLAEGLRRRREQLGLTQTQVAARFGSSQSRVAKMEAAHRSVSTDLLFKSLFRLGASPSDVARLVGQKSRTRAAQRLGAHQRPLTERRAAVWCRACWATSTKFEKSGFRLSRKDL